MSQQKEKTSFKELWNNSLRLLKLSWKMDKKLVISYYLTSLVGAFTPFAAAFVLMQLIDSITLTELSTSAAIPFVIILILGARYFINFIEGVVYWGINQGYLDYLFRYKLQKEFVKLYHEKISTLDIAHFENPKTQDLIAKTRDTMQWQVPENLRTFASLMNSIVIYISAFIALLPFGIWIPLLVSLIAIPRLVILAKYGSMTWSIWSSGAPQVKKLWYLNYVLQDPVTVKETRIQQSTLQLLQKFQSIQEHLYKLSKKPLDAFVRILMLPPLLETFALFAIVLWFFPQVSAGIITLGAFTLIISMLDQLGNQASNASSHLGFIYSNNLYTKNFFDFLAIQNVMKIASEPVKIDTKTVPRIEFKNVDFSYPSSQKVLKNISFVIEPGQNTAFVGENGAGKSTIVKLLCRFYDVDSGEILINGINIKEIDINDWYACIGTLFQDFARYHFSVRENIAVGDGSNASLEAIVAAAKKAGAHEFIDKLPQKYDQILGKEFEEGEEISGGQWQKLAIARAFYESPHVLILDEPTSAIDAEAEHEIFANLEKQYTQKTLVLVSHRFSTVRNADNIIVLHEGEIIESGSHSELLAQNGKYAHMFRLQARGYE